MTVWMFPTDNLPPEPPGTGAAWVALMCGLGSLAPAITILALALFGGTIDYTAAGTLFLAGPVLGLLAIILALVASARAERWGTRLPRRRLPTAVAAALLGVATSVALLLIMIAGIPTT